MIPRKLYIPTTTLNFNNIMASESISPAGFYSVRGFGYKRFDKVEPNNLDRRIILYDKYPNFDINDMELENYPLVIEIAPQYVNEDVIREYKDGVFYTEETIYLNPLSTKIYFRNEGERRLTLSKVEQSLNTKMASIYQSCIHVKTSDIISFEWRNNDMIDSTIDFAKHISKDRRINKLKGLLYAYLFGANRSLSQQVVVLKKHAKELRNALSAIITNPDGYSNYKQKEELEILYKKINDAFYQVEGLGEILLNCIKQKEIEYNCSNFTSILKKEDLYNIWLQKQNLRPAYQINPFNLSFSHKNYPNKKDCENNNSKIEENQKYFDTYFVELDNAIGEHIKSINTNINDLPILQHCNRVEQIPSDKTGFQVKLFNEYKEEHWNREEFLASRLDFATTGGKLFKEELQGNWENSSSKAYINDLRKNLASHTSFALNSVHNLTLQSFAVFCQKGEEDINKLEDYLITNEIGDFRIAFALWGIVFGFANMPKTLTNDLFLLNDTDYISEIYKYIFKQIHGIDLEGKIERIQEKGFVSYSSKMNKQTAITQLSPQTVSYTSGNNSIKKTEFEFYEKLEKKYKGVKSDKNKYIDYLLRFGLTSQLMDVIKNDKLLNKGKGVQKGVISWIEKEISPKKEKPKSKKKNPQESTFQLYQSSGNFLSDFDFLSTDNDFIASISFHKDWRIDLQWFIDSHEKSHKDYEKYWNGKPTDNESVIKQFIFFREGRYKNSEGLLRKLYLSNE